jgi:uncharacterized membrane protein
MFIALFLAAMYVFALFLWLSFKTFDVITWRVNKIPLSYFPCRLSSEPEPEFYKSAVLPDVRETASEPRRDNRRRASFRFFEFLRTDALHTWIPALYCQKLPTYRYSAVRYGHCSSPGRVHLQI